MAELQIGHRKSCLVLSARFRIVNWRSRPVAKSAYCFGNIGPPESMREHVVAASKAMKKGDWKQCSEYILAVKVTEVNMKQIFTDRQTCNIMFVTESNTVVWSLVHMSVVCL